MKNLILLRAARRISAAELARRAGVSCPTVTRCELGQTKPTGATRGKIAEALGAPVAWLFTQDQESGDE